MFCATKVHRVWKNASKAICPKGCLYFCWLYFSGHFPQAHRIKSLLLARKSNHAANESLRPPQYQETWLFRGLKMRKWTSLEHSLLKLYIATSVVVKSKLELESDSSTVLLENRSNSLEAFLEQTRETRTRKVETWLDSNPEVLKLCLDSWL